MSYRKLLLFGNSSSGKSTLAKKLASLENLAHLDLDSLAWLRTQPPTRQCVEVSTSQIIDFIETHNGWVIEGCYTDLLRVAEPSSTEIVYLNIPVEECVTNARMRAWEPHKYESKEAQDKNLDMLIDWIKQYPTKNGTISEQAHTDFYNKYTGKKTKIQDLETALEVNASDPKLG